MGQPILHGGLGGLVVSPLLVGQVLAWAVAEHRPMREREALTRTQDDLLRVGVAGLRLSDSLDLRAQRARQRVVESNAK